MSQTSGPTAIFISLGKKKRGGGEKKEEKTRRKESSKYTYQSGWFKKKKRRRDRIRTSISEKDSRQHRYVLSWKDKSLLIRLVGKRLHYWQEDGICRRGNISYIWPAHSITERGCFSGLYIITRVLFISPRSMVMRGGPRKMDATGRLTYRLLNRDTQGRDKGDQPHSLGWTEASVLNRSYLSHPSVVSYYAWQQVCFSKIYLTHRHVFFWGGGLSFRLCWICNCVSGSGS